jgi:hypothetical protein
MKYVIFWEERQVGTPGPRLWVGILEKESEKTFTVVSGAAENGQYLTGNGRIPKDRIVAVSEDLKTINRAMFIQRMLIDQAEAVIKAAKESYTANFEKLMKSARNIDAEGKKED